MRRMLPRILKVAGAIVGLALVAIVAFTLAQRHAAPTDAVAGPEADALAHRIASSIDEAAWARTGAVRFRFHGETVLWDRARSLARIDFAGARVFVNVATQEGIATRNGARVEGEAGTSLVHKAYARWCNHTFWLNPFVKLFDNGVTRARTTLEGRPALYYGFASGGVTPGDHYEIALGDDGRPSVWRMWVSVLPVAGLEFRALEWTTLATGARLVTRWKAPLKSVAIDDLAGAATLGELEPGPDPFADLLAH